MAANPSAIANLLRLARAECRAAVAFAVVATNGGPAEVLRVPPADVAEALSDETLAEIVDQASQDPEFGRARAFVRSVQLPAAPLLAVAPLLGAAPRAMVGVLGRDPSGFSPAQLELLDRLAERIARHVRAIRAIERPGVERGPEPKPAVSTDPDTLDPEVPDPGAPDPDAPDPAVPDAGALDPGALEAAVPDAGALEAAVPDAGAPPVGPLPLTGTGGTGWLWSEPASPAAPASPGGPAISGTPSVPAVHAEPAVPRSWWAPSDVLTGLPNLGQFFSRAGRLLASEARASGAVALVIVEVPSERTAPAAARALAGQLRFSDPLARIDRDLFAAAVLLFPGSVRGDAVEERLGAAVRSALDWLAPVRTTHVLAEPGDRRDVDELVRQAMAGLPGRTPVGSLR